MTRRFEGTPVLHPCPLLTNGSFVTPDEISLGSATPLSASMVAFYTVMLQFVNNICLIGSLTLYSRIVDSIAILFKAYLNRTIQVYEERGMTDEQRAVANSNFQFISESFISRVIVQLRHQFDRPIPELDVVREELGGKPHPRKKSTIFIHCSARHLENSIASIVLTVFPCVSTIS